MFKHGFIDLGILFFHNEHFLSFFTIITLLLLLAALVLDLFLKDYIDRDLIVLLKVAGHTDFVDRRVIDEIKEEAIKMDVDGAGTEVIETQLFFELENTADRTLQHFLDEDALLRVHDLIIALLKLAVDLDVFDVEYDEVPEAFFETPKLAILYSENLKRVRIFKFGSGKS